MKEVKWGIIAAGSIANAFAHSIKYSENATLSCVLGRNEEKLILLLKNIIVSHI